MSMSTSTQETPRQISLNTKTTMHTTTTMSSTTTNSDDFPETTKSIETPMNSDTNGDGNFDASTKIKTEAGTLDDFLNSLDGQGIEQEQQQLLEFIQSSGVKNDIYDGQLSHVLTMIDITIDETKLFTSKSTRSKKDAKLLNGDPFEKRTDYERKAAQKFMRWCNKTKLGKNSPSDVRAKSSRKPLKQNSGSDSNTDCDFFPCEKIQLSQKRSVGATENMDSQPKRALRSSKQVTSEYVYGANDDEKNSKINTGFNVSEKKSKNEPKHSKNKHRSEKRNLEDNDDNPMYYASTDSESEICDNSVIKSHGNFSGNKVADGGEMLENIGDIPLHIDKNDSASGNIVTGVRVLDESSGNVPMQTETDCGILPGTQTSKTFPQSKDLEASNNVTSDFDNALQNFQEETRIQSRKVIAIPLETDTWENSQKKSSKTKKSHNKSSRFKCKVCKKSFTDKQSASCHFVSRRHARKTLNHPDRIKMMEKYHSYMLYLSPFQCQICRFYCNSAMDLRYHLESIDHVTMTKLVDVITCAGCNFLCDDNAKIVEHIAESKHRDSHQLSKAVIIKQLQYHIKCKFCDKICSLKRMKVHLERLHVSGLKSKVQTALTKTPTQCKLKGDKHGNYSCNMCKFSTKSSKTFLTHYRTYHGERPFYCDPCGLSFVNAHGYGIHLSTLGHLRMDKANTNITITKPKADQELVFECVECDEKFSNDSLLLIHKRVNHPGCSQPVENHECDTCGKKFEDEKLLQLHKYSHTHLTIAADVRKFYHGTDQVSIKYHDFLNEIESKSSKSFIKCPECKRCPQKTSIVEHLRLHVDEMIFVCPICSLGHKHATGLKTHMEKHLGITKTCNKCGAKVSPKYYLEHVRLHSGKTAPQICHFCSKKCATRHILLFHIRKYHSEKKYICDWPKCGSRFALQRELHRHAWTHSGYKPYHCEHCNYRSGRKRTITEHMERQHQKTVDRHKTHLCNHCGYFAPTKRHLKLHVRIHTNTRPFRCPYCPLRTHALDNLRKHIMNSTKHRGLKVYQCKFCKFSTNTATEYKAHVLELHQDKIDMSKSIVCAELAGIFTRADVAGENL